MLREIETIFGQMSQHGHFNRTKNEKQLNNTFTKKPTNFQKVEVFRIVLENLRKITKIWLNRLSSQWHAFTLLCIVDRAVPTLEPNPPHAGIMYKQGARRTSILAQRQLDPSGEADRDG